MSAAMIAFDRLPRAVRRRLDDGAFNYDARAIAGARRSFGLTTRELLAFIDALDGHARIVLASATRIAGANRMDAPDPDEVALVACIRSKADDLHPRAG